ncbi:uncharacterized protein LOC126367468 isoform X2 [Pectinophora gossypiella]|nr:uncharacterized protein LOC126367468 isoform X2 [Pectinophora gossypiella]
MTFIEAKKMKFTCYERIVFVDKVSEDKIRFRIDQTKTKQNVTTFKCCYKFASRSIERDKEDIAITYTSCVPFENDTVTVLEEEVVIVSCIQKANKKTVFTYEDAYLILKKQYTEHLKLQVKEDAVIMKDNWNVLIVGMDTMSRARAHHSIPKTLRYMREHDWLDYQGYQKVGANTYPNIMAILTGKNYTEVSKACGMTMDNCQQLLIWNKFRDAGYVTAYGEDNLKLPDTFSTRHGFKTPPTDHYTRPFFLTGEHRIGNLVCTKSRPSAEHMLDYALQFAQEYKNDSFFGFFWINSYSHNLDNLPTLLENNLINFFENLRDVGTLDNTFVIFLSDHGIRFGKVRFQTEAYYEERLPMLFMWVPHAFRETYPEEYHILKLNQYRLTTPYDLHATLWDFMKMTTNWIDIVPPEACPECKSFTKEVSPNRTCADVQVSQKWCTCHNLTDATHDPAANRSLELAVAFVQNRSKSIKTAECTMCSPLILKTVLRQHSYRDGNNTYYVVAFMFSSGPGFEATVEHDGNNFNILPFTDPITSYNMKGYCVINKLDRPYCSCLKVSKCKKKNK